MKDLLTKLLQNLPVILNSVPALIKLMPVIIILAVLGLAGWYVMDRMPAWYVCAGNQLWTWKIGSNAYTFDGETCIDASMVEKYR